MSEATDHPGAKRDHDRSTRRARGITFVAIHEAGESSYLN